MSKKRPKQLPRFRALIISANVHLVSTARSVLADFGVDCRVLSEVPASMSHMQRPRPSVMLIDTGGSSMEQQVELVQSVREHAVMGGCVLIALTSASGRGVRDSALLRAGYDYVCQPDDAKLFHEQVAAILRRFGRASGKPLRRGDVLLDRSQCVVQIGAQRKAIGRAQFVVLFALARRSPRVLTLEDLSSELRHDEGELVSPSTLRVRISRLRKALGDWAPLVEHVKNGYRWGGRATRG